jgi:phosphoglycolate phosphatase
MTFEEMNKPLWTMDETMARVRKSLRDSFPEMFGDQWKKAETVFYTAFTSIHIEHLQAFDKSEELLKLMRSKDILLGVVSNKTGQYLRDEVEHLGWSGYFHKIIGARDAKNDKPALDPMILALKGTGFVFGQGVWFVGDTSVDMEIAHKGQCKAILIDDGHLDDDFKLYPPDAKFPVIDDLINIVAEWP